MGMGEKNNHTQSSFGFFSRKPLLCLFSFTSILFTLSWFFVLRSAGRPTRIIDHSFLLPNTKVHSTIDTSQSKNQNEAKPSFTNRSILVDDDNEEESSASKSNRRDSALKCNSSNVVLKVFMYDLPSEFHFELLDWKAEGGESSVWPDIRTKIPHYPGGLNLQHSIEYWLTLDLLSSEFDKSSPRSAVRVHNSSEADVIFVPFFSSLCYNRYSKVNPHQKRSKNKLLQEKLVRYLTAQEEWKRSGGRDHIVMAHHPNSMLDARMKLWPATFILSDFGRYPPNIANVEKDVIVPYKHVIRSYVNDASDFDSRTTLLYFQGAIYRKDGGFVRQELFYLLKDEKDVHFSFGSVQKDGISKATQGMHSSKFCLNIAGDTPSSNRLFDAIASHCVPVIISDEIELPYEDVLDYSKFCIFVRASDAVKDLAGNTPSSNRLFDVIASHCVPVIISDEIELPYEDVLDYSKFCIFVRTSDAVKEKFLINLIRSIGKDEWTQMWKRLKEVENFFEYKYPSREGDAVQMIWQAVARKVPAIHLKLHKSRRFARTPQAHRDRWLNTIPTPSNFWKRKRRWRRKGGF